jgi:diacylglycerol kinase family enzyme
VWKCFKEFKFENLLKNTKENPEAGLKYIRTNFLRYIPLHNLNDDNDISSKNDIPTYVNIDGESYGMQPFQIKVRQKCVNIYSFKKK